MIERETLAGMRDGHLMQAVVFQIPVEFPVVVAANVHFCEDDAEHALVKAVVALTGAVWSYARTIANAVNHLLRSLWRK